MVFLLLGLHKSTAAFLRFLFLFLFLVSFCCLYSFQTVPQLLALARLVLHTPGVLLNLMVQPIACVLNRARHPLTSFAGVMGKLTVTLVNWRRTLAIVTELLQSRAKDFAKVSENDTRLTRSVNRAFSKQNFSTLITHRKLIENKSYT